MIRMTSIVLCLSTTLGVSTNNEWAASSTSIRTRSVPVGFSPIAELIVELAKKHQHNHLENRLSRRDLRCLHHLVKSGTVQLSSILVSEIISITLVEQTFLLLHQGEMYHGVEDNAGDTEDGEELKRATEVSMIQHWRMFNDIVRAKTLAL